MIAKHLIGPLLRWCMVRGDLAGDEGRQKEVINLLGKDVNRYMPDKITEAQIELACERIFDGIRDRAKTPHWPVNSVVIEATVEACKWMPTGNDARRIERPKPKEREPYVPIEDLPDDKLQSFLEATLANIRQVDTEPYKSPAMDKAVRGMLTATRERIEQEIAKRRAAREAA